MALEALDEPGVIEGWGVTFAMTEDGNRVRCHVGGDALEDIEHSDNPGEAERLRIFQRNRQTFERLAGKLYDAGHEPRVASKHLPRPQA